MPTRTAAAMEPVGLAVGLVGLAGLFNTCLDVIDKFESYKDFSQESHSLDARFRAQKLRLEQWMKAVGFDENRISDTHHRALDDKVMASMVRDLILAIKNCCGDQDGPALLQLPAPRESKRTKINWALRSKTKRISQIEKFVALVQTLYDLIPLDGPKPSHQTSGGIREETIADKGGFAVKLQQLLDRIEADIEGWYAEPSFRASEADRE